MRPVPGPGPKKLRTWTPQINSYRLKAVFIFMQKRKFKSGPGSRWQILAKTATFQLDTLFEHRELRRSWRIKFIISLKNKDKKRKFRFKLYFYFSFFTNLFSKVKIKILSIINNVKKLFFAFSTNWYHVISRFFRIKIYYF